MALDPRKRQKKVERKRAKQKTRHNEMRPFDRYDFKDRMERVEGVPFLHCITRQDIFDKGIGTLLVSRQFPNGTVAYAGFLLDLYCLGVKDAFYGVSPRNVYEFKVHEKLLGDHPVVHLEPSEAKKLIEGAVRFAADYGLAPHADYAKAKLILVDVDASQCETTFEYGKDGQPFFISGPFDGLARIEEILSTIAAHSRAKKQEPGILSRLGLTARS